MPELPDITVYLHALRARLDNQTLRQVTLNSPFLLRSVGIAPEELVGSAITSFERFGKRLVLGFEQDRWFVLHLMIAGRLQWRDAPARAPGRSALISLGFDNGVLWLTEAGSKKRASLHICRGAELDQHRRDGLEPLEANAEAFATRLTLRNHTLKRALTDPGLFSGIGNAYSDEILHRAGLSPVALTQSLDRKSILALHAAVQSVLQQWTRDLLAEVGEQFPKKVTAFREGMAVHGRYGLPCPACTTRVQRIRYASNETNYCPRCQTGGKLLADRSLSRLLKRDWPRSIDEMEQRQRVSDDE